MALGHDSSLLRTSPTLWDCTAAASQVVKSYAAPPIQPAQRLVTRFRPAGCGMMWPRHLIIRSRVQGFGGVCSECDLESPMTSLLAAVDDA